MFCMITVQAILGHKYIDTTLGYARLYDGTIAADYYRAMHSVEHNLRFDGASETSNILEPGQLVALVDSLKSGTLNDQQRETVQVIRDALVRPVEKVEK